MSWRPPPLATAHLLIEDVLTFLEECGGPYQNIRGQINKTKYDGLIRAIWHGQFVFRKGWYFASWFRLTPETMAQVKQYTMPHDITSGDILYIAEFGVKQGIRELKRKIESRNKAWCRSWCKHRNTTTWKFFRRIP